MPPFWAALSSVHVRPDKYTSKGALDPPGGRKILRLAGRLPSTFEVKEYLVRDPPKTLLDDCESIGEVSLANVSDSGVYLLRLSYLLFKTRHDEMFVQVDW